MYAKFIDENHVQTYRPTIIDRKPVYPPAEQMKAEGYKEILDSTENPRPEPDKIPIPYYQELDKDYIIRRARLVDRPKRLN